MRYLWLLAFIVCSCHSKQEEEVPQVELPPIPQIVPADLPWVTLHTGPVQLNNEHATVGYAIGESLGADHCQFGRLRVGEEAWLHATHVDGFVEIGGEGRFYATCIEGCVTVGETLHACNSKFCDAVHVCGDLFAECSTFEGPITARAEIMKFDNCQTHAIVVEPTGPYYDKQVIVLSGKTIVAGDIVFESCRGRVLQEPDAVLLGNIIGGHMIPTPQDKVELEHHSL